MRQLYLLSMALVVAGSGLLFGFRGWRPAVAFLVGGLLSFGNLWLFERMSRGIAPEEGKAPQARSTTLFVLRYVALLALVYATVNALGLDPVPMFAGLFASTAAVLIVSVLEIVKGLFRRASSS